MLVPCRRRAGGPRGAGTGLSGGALPHARGVTLSLAKFNRILEWIRSPAPPWCSPGVRNLAISEAAAPHGLYYAPDPSQPDRLHHRRQRRREFRRRALPEVRAHAAQRAARCAASRSTARRSNSASEALDAPGLDLLALVRRQRRHAGGRHRGHGAAACRSRSSPAASWRASPTSRRPAPRSRA